MDYIVTAIVARIPVSSEDLLSAYEASDIHEAARNQAQWCDEGATEPVELLGCADSVDVTFLGLTIEDPS